MDQFEKFESLYFYLSKRDRQFVEDTTGCLYPCSYPEFRIVAEKIYNYGRFGVFISYGSVAVTVKKEVKLSSWIKLSKVDFFKSTRCTVTILSR